MIPMKTLSTSVSSLIALALLVTTAACGPPVDPELVAIAYERASAGGDPDTAVNLLDTEQITSRVEEEIVVVESGGSESFLEDSIETLLWALFREIRPADFAYTATPADIDGDSAEVTVTKLSPDGVSSTVVVHLRKTDDGWRVSGASLDRLVTYSVQRLQEMY